MEPRVSIVTPVFNDEQFVAEMLDSVRGQTFGEWEHVLVDDGSTDRSADIIEEYCARDGRLRLIRQANAGTGKARLAGYAETGDAEFVLFLDHDDVLQPEMLGSLVAYLDTHPEVSAVYCGLHVIDEAGGRSDPGWTRRLRSGAMTVSYVPQNEPATPFEALLMWGGILPSNALIRRSAYERVGGFDTRYFNDDTDLFMRIALEGAIHYLDQPLMLYRRHAAQMSADTDRTSAELDRLLAGKWGAVDLSPRDWRRLERARNLRAYGAPALLGAVAARQRVRAWQFGAAARFLGGAARRYLLYVGANLGLVRRPPPPPPPADPAA